MRNPSNRLIAWTIGPLGIAAAGVIVGLSVQANAGETAPQETVTTVVTSTAVVQPPAAPAAVETTPDALPAETGPASTPEPVAPPTVDVVSETPQQPTEDTPATHVPGSPMPAATPGPPDVFNQGDYLPPIATIEVPAPSAS